MGFEEFGYVTHTVESKAGAFVEGLREGRVMATKCKQCGARMFPPQVDCPMCVHGETEWFEIGSKGKLLTYTSVNYGPVGFEEKTPYTIGVGQFGEGIQILAHLSKNIERGDIFIGMPIKVVPVALPDNKIAFEFSGLG